MHTLKTETSGEYIRAKALAAKLNCGESTIWKMARDGRLPQPATKLGARCTLWHWPSVQEALRGTS